MLDRQQRERLRIYMGGAPRRPTARVIAESVNWEIVAAFVILLGFFGFLLWQGLPTFTVVGTVGFIAIGWVFSLCLHEFAHAATAVLGGDDSESTRVYLSFNPLRYLHPVLSIVMPLIFLLLGGIGLPGGAVYLQINRVRSRVWQSGVSLAGPLMNLLLAGLLSLPFRLGLLDAHPTLAAALGLLALLQVSAALLNLIPVPPLDGYGVLAPWLAPDLRRMAASAGIYTFLLVFLLLQWGPVNNAFFGAVFRVMETLGADPFAAFIGLNTFFFWKR